MKINWKKLDRILNYLRWRIRLSGIETSFKPNKKYPTAVTIYYPDFYLRKALKGNLKIAQKRYISDVAHEIGHYIVARPSRKKKKDYGIPLPKFMKSISFWDLEEYKACVAQRAIEFIIGTRNSWPTASHSSKNVRRWWNKIGSEQTKKFLIDAKVINEKTIS